LHGKFLADWYTSMIYIYILWHWLI
jgi:hypothetical protein